MSAAIRVRVPRETAALSLGADEVAAAISAAADAAGQPVELVRNGSWGMSWLEPLVEVETGGERVAYGPVTVDDVESLVAADFLSGGVHALSLGPVEDIPYLRDQLRWTFRRIGEPRPDLRTAAAACVHAGGAHHTGFSIALRPEHLEDFADMAGIEYVLIDQTTTLRQIKNELRWNDAAYGRGHA